MSRDLTSAKHLSVTLSEKDAAQDRVRQLEEERDRLKRESNDWQDHADELAGWVARLCEAITTVIEMGLDDPNAFETLHAAIRPMNRMQVRGRRT